MIPDDHEISNAEAQVGASCGVGYKQILYADDLHHADRQNYLGHVVALVVMDSALHGNNCLAAEGAHNKAAFMADGGRYGESRNVAVGDLYRVLNLVRKFAKAGAKDYAHGGFKLSKFFADVSGRGIYGFKVCHSDSIILVIRRVILSAAMFAAATTSSPSFS